VDDSTADVTIWLLIGALRNFPIGMSALRAGEWRGNTLPRLGHDPQGKVLGILGMGGIGRNVATKARAFGMKIRYYNRNRLAPELEDGAEYVSFEELLAESDVLSLNLPLNVGLIPFPPACVLHWGVCRNETDDCSLTRDILFPRRNLRS
jgi:lactate dehydrogenase-like 2-hydroxyacid dehydrogenase